jgi:hypothetical protein
MDTGLGSQVTRPETFMACLGYLPRFMLGKCQVGALVQGSFVHLT